MLKASRFPNLLEIKRLKKNKITGCLIILPNDSGSRLNFYVF